MKQVYTPQHIANFFLAKKNHDIDNLKLNKLVYISYGWVYALVDREIFHEPIQAWRFGPVIPSIYHEFKYFGHRIIDRLSQIVDDWFEDELIQPMIDESDEQLINILEQIDEKYRKKFNSTRLVGITHAKGTPWKETYKNNSYNTEIPKDKIKRYYEGLANA